MNTIIGSPCVSMLVYAHACPKPCIHILVHACTYLFIKNAHTSFQYAYSYSQVFACMFGFANSFIPSCILTLFHHTLVFVNFKVILLLLVGAIWLPSWSGSGLRPWWGCPASRCSRLVILRVLPAGCWCRHWLRGVGILPTPSTLLVGRWPWLPMIFVGWPSWKPTVLLSASRACQGQHLVKSY